MIEARYTLQPLDTLSPVPALSPDAPDTDPLAGLERLAVIQPRGLSPADNVALDQWVRGGGRLLGEMVHGLRSYRLLLPRAKGPAEARPGP